MKRIQTQLTAVKCIISVDEKTKHTCLCSLFVYRACAERLVNKIVRPYPTDGHHNSVNVVNNYNDISFIVRELGSGGSGEWVMGKSLLL